MWPGNASMFSEYNRGRERSYIEDRADLTLLEVKHLFERMCPDGKAEKKGKSEDGEQGDRSEYRQDLLFSKIEWKRRHQSDLRGGKERYEIYCF